MGQESRTTEKMAFIRYCGVSEISVQYLVLLSFKHVGIRLAADPHYAGSLPPTWGTGIPKTPSIGRSV